MPRVIIPGTDPKRPFTFTVEENASAVDGLTELPVGEYSFTQMPVLEEKCKTVLIGATVTAEVRNHFEFYNAWMSTDGLITAINKDDKTVRGYLGYFGTAFGPQEEAPEPTP